MDKLQVVEPESQKMTLETCLLESPANRWVGQQGWRWNKCAQVDKVRQTKANKVCTEEAQRPGLKNGKWGGMKQGVRNCSLSWKRALKDLG